MRPLPCLRQSFQLCSLIVFIAGCETSLGSDSPLGEGGQGGEPAATGGEASATGGASEEAGGCEQLYEEFEPSIGVSFAEDLMPLLQQHCTTLGCHGGSDPDQAQANLWLGPRDREATSEELDFIYQSLVDVRSVVAPQLALVRSQNARESYFMRKLDGCHVIEDVECALDPKVYGDACGDPMPPLGAGLTESERAEFRSWIMQGAGKN